MLSETSNIADTAACEHHVCLLAAILYTGLPILNNSLLLIGKHDSLPPEPGLSKWYVHHQKMKTFTTIHFIMPKSAIIRRVVRCSADAGHTLVLFTSYYSSL